MPGRLIDQTPVRWARYHIAPGYFRQPRRWNMEKPDLVFNQISDIDQNPMTLAVAEQMTAPIRDRLLNNPQMILRTGREDVSSMLQNVPGLMVPRVIRVENPTYSELRDRLEIENFQFPIIARRPGTHSGAVLGLFNQPEDMQAMLEQHDGDLILTEYKEFRSADGLYRKMRLFFIGDRIVFRHLLFSENWNVHARDRIDLMAERPDLREEEQAMVESGGAALLENARDGLEKIQELIGLDYFGIDCAVAPSGDLLIFEINATMNFLPLLDDPKFYYLQTSMNHAVYAMDLLLKERVDRHDFINA